MKRHRPPTAGGSVSIAPRGRPSSCAIAACFGRRPITIRKSYPDSDLGAKCADRAGAPDEACGERGVNSALLRGTRRRQTGIAVDAVAFVVVVGGHGRVCLREW